jgi:8-oxo-dGTP pyrophosphatase MutT (NUDIX family)
MIYKDLPEKFNPKFEVVSCFVECDGKILLLQRQDNKSQGGKWGVPAGKIDEGESEKLAVLREVKEETGIALNNDSVKHSKKVFVRYPDYDFVFDIFKSEIKNFPDVVLSKEENDVRDPFRQLRFFLRLVVAIAFEPHLERCEVEREPDDERRRRVVDR